MPIGKKSQKCKEKYCQIALFSSKNATESLKPSTVLCFDFLIFPLKVLVRVAKVVMVHDNLLKQ
jgi:hypothetical protein